MINNATTRPVSSVPPAPTKTELPFLPFQDTRESINKVNWSNIYGNNAEKGILSLGDKGQVYVTEGYRRTPQINIQSYRLKGENNRRLIKIPEKTPKKYSFVHENKAGELLAFSVEEIRNGFKALTPGLFGSKNNMRELSMTETIKRVGQVMRDIAEFGKLVRIKK